MNTQTLFTKKYTCQTPFPHSWGNKDVNLREVSLRARKEKRMSKRLPGVFLISPPPVLPLPEIYPLRPQPCPSESWTLGKQATCQDVISVPAFPIPFAKEVTKKAAHLGKIRGKIFETEKRCVESWKDKGQGLGERKTNSDGPFSNFFRIVFPCTHWDFSRGGSKKLWGCAEGFVCPR